MAELAMEKDILVEDEGEGQQDPEYETDGLLEDNFGTYRHEQPKQEQK